MAIITLQAELERNMNETHHLMETRKNLEKALQETEGPMRVTSECIYHREGRKVCLNIYCFLTIFVNIIFNYFNWYNIKITLFLGNRFGKR
jgi:hypothetical protein